MTAAEEKWSSRVSAWRSSGKTLREFSELEGLSASSLRWWSTRLKKLAAEGEATPASTSKIAMARVHRVPPKRDAPRVFVEVAGARIVVERGFDVELLREVIRALAVTVAPR
jgi:hypothetical protein